MGLFALPPKAINDCSPMELVETAERNIQLWEEHSGDYLLHTARSLLLDAIYKLTGGSREKDNNRLEELLGEYWDIAYKEGKEGRVHDTEDGKAQSTLNEIRNLFHKQK